MRQLNLAASIVCLFTITAPNLYPFFPPAPGEDKATAFAAWIYLFFTPYRLPLETSLNPVCNFFKSTFIYIILSNKNVHLAECHTIPLQVFL